MNRLNDLKGFVSEFFLGFVLSNRSAFAARLRARFYKTRCFLDTGVIITNRSAFQSGENCALYHGCYILNPHGLFKMGSNSHLGAYCYINACYGSVQLGRDVAVGPGTMIFSYSNHYSPGQRATEVKITKDVQIGNNVFIGANSTILPGVTIGDDVVVGAGAVVRSSLAPGRKYAGVPARELA